MDQHLLHLLAIDLVLLDEVCDKSDCAHLAHQRRVEADFTDAIEDVGGCNGHSRADERVNVDNHHIARIAVVDQGENSRVAHITAIPVVLPIDCDRLEQGWHTGRSKHCFGADVLARENAYFPRLHIGRA
ncbi:hypothetical protein D3C71_1829470 [compost metagenome]